MKGMTIKAIVEACEGVFHGDETIFDKEISMVTTDSRTIEKDGMFVAIKGERSDGHKFIGQCLEKGALCCISERELEDETGCYIEVKSSVEALQAMAKLYLDNLGCKVVGITGSVGKTSTKETIHSVLSEKYTVLKTLGNFNNEIGLPLTVFRLTPEDEIAVLEMGISDFGEMTVLAKIARPDVMVITNIGLCHLENLKTRDGILQAKTEVFDYMDKESHVILNCDDDKLVSVNVVNGKVPLFFGIKNKSAVYADNIENLGLDGTRCILHNVETSDGIKDFTVHIPVPGEHMVYNTLAAAVVATCFGLSSEQITEGLKKLQTIAGRNNIIKTDRLTIIDDCYNANPVSMKASIDVISTAIGRRVCILGDMFELGKDEKQLHYDVGEYLGSKNIDLLLAIGDLSKELADGALDYMDQHYDAYECEVHHYKTKEECISRFNDLIKDDDSILVKASHGMEFSEIVNCLKSL